MEWEGCIADECDAVTQSLSAQKKALQDANKALIYLDNTMLPDGLLSLTFGSRFRRSLDNTRLPSTLQSLTFGTDWNRSLDNTMVHIVVPEGRAITAASLVGIDASALL